MEEDFVEVNDVPEGSYDIVETNTDVVDVDEPLEFQDEGDEPLDLGEPHEMSDEEFEEFKQSLSDNQEKIPDISIDEKIDEFGNEEDEPLDLGEPHEMSDEEFEELKESLNDNQEENSDIVIDEKTDEFEDEGDEPLDLGTPHEPSLELKNEEKEPYVEYEKTEDYKDRAINGTAEDLHKGFIGHLRGYVSEDVKEDLPPIDDDYKK